MLKLGKTLSFLAGLMSKNVFWEKTRWEKGKRGGRKRIPRWILIFDSHSFGDEKRSGKIISVSDEKSADIANR